VEEAQTKSITDCAKRSWTPSCLHTVGFHYHDYWWFTRCGKLHMTPAPWQRLPSAAVQRHISPIYYQKRRGKLYGISLQSRIWGSSQRLKQKKSSQWRSYPERPLSLVSLFIPQAVEIRKGRWIGYLGWRKRSTGGRGSIWGQGVAKYVKVVEGWRD
jgi:hypothetical protein